MTDKPTTPEQIIEEWKDFSSNFVKHISQNKNMDTITPTQQESLNEKILDIINNSKGYDFIADGVTREYFSEDKAANAIERLILMSQKELLTNIFYELGNQDSTPEYVLETIQDEIVSITNTLNQLP